MAGHTNETNAQAGVHDAGADAGSSCAYYAGNSTYAATASTGAKLWNYTTRRSVESSPAYANGIVYVGGDDYNIYAFNATNGVKLWNYTTGLFVTSSPAVVNGVLYLGGTDGKLYAIGNQTAPPSPTTTTLNATAPSTAYATQTFSIKGSLSANGTAVGSKTITVQRSLDNATWTTAGTATTNATTGAYQFKRSETGTGLYYYRALFAGDTAYTSATSNVVIVTITKMPTKLTILAPVGVSTGDGFTVSGTLAANGAGLGGQNVSLYRYSPTADAWAKVAVVTTSASGTVGSYSFTVTENAADTYAYQVMYARTTTYRPTASAAERVDVT